MKFILEIQTVTVHPPAELEQAEAVLLDDASSLAADANRVPWLDRCFLRVKHESDLEITSRSRLLGFAAQTTRGQFDLDRISAVLRVAEIKSGQPEQSTRLILFPYPDLASLAEHLYPLSGSPRLFAIAHDERPFIAHETDRASRTPSPLLYARVQSVALARRLGVTAYLRPNWTSNDHENEEIVRAAKADGFDGLIGAAERAPIICNT